MAINVPAARHPVSPYNIVTVNVDAVRVGLVARHRTQPKCSLVVARSHFASGSLAAKPLKVEVLFG